MIFLDNGIVLSRQEHGIGHMASDISRTLHQCKAPILGDRLQLDIMVQVLREYLQKLPNKASISESLQRYFIDFKKNN